MGIDQIWNCHKRKEGAYVSEIEGGAENYQKRKFLKMENISHGFEKLPRTIKPKKENEISKYGISFFGISFLGNRVSKNQKKLIKNKKKFLFGNFF